MLTISRIKKCKTITELNKLRSEVGKDNNFDWVHEAFAKQRYKIVYDIKKNTCKKRGGFKYGN